MKLYRCCLVAVALSVCLASSTARCDVTLPSVFGDNMVLQRDREIPVWGKAKPGEKVTVRLGENQASSTADEKGKWMARLPAVAAGGPHELIVQGDKPGDKTLTLHNVLVGEVWVCSGQSNMEWPMTRIDNSEQEIEAADYPRLRLFSVKRTTSETPLDDVEASWSICTPESVPDFSAVAYFFGRRLHEHLDVPVGLLKTAWGGTPAEHWTPSAMFEADPTLTITAEHPHARDVMEKRSSLYNGMISPLVPFAIRGAIWYQGESNVPMGEHYHKLFSSMIAGWRKAWNQGDFPFLFVQIAPWDYSKVDGWPPEGCPLVREAQAKTLALKNTAMVVTMDIGDVEDIHPTNKQDVGARLARAARAVAYGEDIVYSGPMYRSHEIVGNQIVLHFDHADGGLVSHDGPPRTFQIAGKDRRFVDATATIQGETVVVHSDDVSAPVAVRFAWKDTALPNLFNKHRLPASPFRTDSWPVLPNTEVGDD